MSPRILIESIFIKGADGTILPAAARLFTKSDVLAVVKMVLRNYNNVGAVVEKMKETEILADFNLDDLSYRKWEPSLVKKFVADICNAIHCPLPREEGIPFLLDFALNSVVDSFLNNQVEEQDVIPMVKTLADGDAAYIDAGINIINRRCPYLALYVARHLGKPAIAFEEKFPPKCSEEANERLHTLPVSGEVVVENKVTVDNFIVHLKKSRHIAMDFHSVDSHLELNDRVGLVSFNFRSKIYIVMPHLYPETIRPIRRALRDNPLPTFVLNWGRRKKDCQKTFDWTPEEVVEADKVAKEHGVHPSIDAMVDAVVGGKFCRRASNFSDVVTPSKVALRHRAVRVAVIYEFIVKMRGLRDQRQTSDRDRAEKRVRGGAACAPAYHARSVSGSGRDRNDGSLPRKYARRDEEPARNRR